MPFPLVRAAAVVGLVAATMSAAPAVASVSTPALISPTPGATQLSIVGVNDFHGRILDAERFGATAIAAEREFGSANSLLISNGDAVSASVFESAIARDQPTIDALNALGVASFTVGNHEFDHGADDATGRIQNATAGPDLAANVTAADGSHPFDEYALFTVAGVTVAVIGAVTDETPALSAAGAVSALSFGDPVAAVNRVAAQLRDGDPANGEADVLIASYHAGAPASDVPLAENERSEVFRSIVADTDPAVAAIFTAHTHQSYAYDAPVAGGTRPVVQAGSYGAKIAQVVLTIDADGAVTASASSIVPTFAADAIPADIAADPRLVDVRAIVADAVAASDALGSEVVGRLSADITRAKQFSDLTIDPVTRRASGTVTVPDDRANASALSDLVAESMVGAVNARGNVTADLALMNPGGVRADLLSDDGIITYKEAANVVPFANDLVVATLTGEVLRQVLEQQWQTNADGSVPARAYLQLGLSNDVTYTYDDTRPAGSRITGITLRGEPLAPGRTVNVAMSSFLAGGGDNLRALLQASDVVGTGTTDTDAFPSWLRSVSGPGGLVLGTDDRRNQMRVVGAGETLACTADIEVSGFDLGSVGFVQNDVVTVSYRDDEVGRAIVTSPNRATVELAFAAGAAGRGDLVITAEPSGSTVMLPLAVECAAEPTPGVSPTASAPTDAQTDDSAGSSPGAAPSRLPDTGADGARGLTLGIGAVVVVGAGVAAVVIARRRGRG